MEKGPFIVDMPRRRQSRRMRNRRSTKRRRRQSGGYGIMDSKREIISRLVGDEGMGVPTMEEVPTA